MIDVTAPPARDRNDLAPGWHTALLVGLIVAVATAGSLLVEPSVPPPPANPGAWRLAMFAPLIVMQWGLVVYVARVGRRRWALGALMGTRWPTARRAIVDVGCAAGVALLIVALESACSSFLSGRHGATVRADLPHSAVAVAAWLVVALSVGFCEEVVYRGYLQKQLASVLRSPAVGCLGSAILFGVAHAEQGAAAAVRAGIYGLVLGATAHFRGSLIPGILAHTSIDIAAGLVMR